MQTHFTTRPFERAHGTKPRGRGSWAFQQCNSYVALNADLFGPVEFFQGTYSEAKRQAKAHFPSGSLLAVLS